MNSLGKRLALGGLLACLVGMVGLGFAGPVSAQKKPEFTFRLHHLLPPVSHAHKNMLVPWAKRVEEASKGRIKIDIYPAMQLGGTPPQLAGQAADGVVDIVWTVTGYTPGRFKQTEVFELPFMHSSTVATTLALNEYVAKHGDEYKDYQLIVMHVHAGQVFHSHDPIRTVADMRGTKIRTPTRTGAWLIEALGATPIGAPVPKIPEMLSKRIVDTVLIPYEISGSLKVHEMVKYHTTLDDPKFTRINTTTFMIAMNKASYARLPADLRKVIDDNSGFNIAEWIGKSWDEAEIPGRDLAAQTGELIKMSPVEVAKLRALVEGPVTERWIADVSQSGVDGRALVAEARALIEKHTK